MVLIFCTFLFIFVGVILEWFVNIEKWLIICISMCFVVSQATKH